MWLFIAFLAVPLIEIALFIQVGGWIGLWPTLAVVVATALLGTVMVRSQGMHVLRRIQSSLETLEDPTEPLAHGAMILFSGALLLTPGFFTDAVGFALLVPAVRARVFVALREAIKERTVRVHGARRPDSPDPHRPGGHRPDPHRPDVIDAEFHEIDPDKVEPRRTSRPSGWTRR